MPSLLARILLFLSSYFPLTLIFFILWLEDHAVLACGALLLGVGSVIWLIYYLGRVDTFAGVTISVEGVERRDNEAMSYIFSYIIPFLAVASSAWQQAVALLIFFLMLGFLYVNSNMIHINPTLNFLRYHLYEVTLADGSARTLVTKRKRLFSEERIQVVEVGDDILFEKRSDS